MANYYKYDGIQIVRMLLLAAVYYGTSKFGFSLAYVAEQVTVVWPPTGISLAAILLFGWRIWPGIFLGALLTNVTAHEPVITALGIATGNTLEAFSGFWLLRRYAGPGPYLKHVRGVLGLIFFSAAISTMASATIGTISLCLGGVQPWANFDSIWFVWWLGDAGGALIAAPLLLAWGEWPYPALSLRADFEVLTLAAATLATNFVIFIEPSLIGMTRPYPYMIFPVVIWAAISFGQRGVTLITLFLSGVAIWATSHQLGPFADMPIGEALDVLQTFTIVISATGLLMSAAMSERFESEKIESQSRIRLNAVLENIVDGLITIDGKGIIRSYNRACTKIFGYAAEDVIGKNVKMLMPAEHAVNHDTYINNYIKTGRAKIIGIGRELEGLRKDGTTFPMDLSVAEVTSGSGSERLFSGIIRDISERKLAEKKIQDAHQFLQSVIDHIPDPVFMKDRQHRLTGGNKAMWALLGGASEKFIGSDPHTFLKEEEIPLFYAGDDEVFNSNQTTVKEEEFTDHKGERHILSTKKTSFFNEKGEQFLVGAARDITDLKKKETQLLKYTQELKRSNQELDDFAYIASHDLKEPLRGLLTQTSFLLEDYQGKLDMDGVRRLQRLTYLSQRMEKLISDLLYFSRLGRTELAVQETDPNEVVMEVQQMMDTFLKEHQAHITIPQPMPHVTCDKLRIAEVFRNLITNAVKYNDKPERLVEVGYLKGMKRPHSNEKGAFYVKDNGVGIDPEFHEAIFRIFKRLDNPAVKNEEGTGSGLTFVKKIIERHKGHIWLDSEPDKGSVFYFTLGSKDV